LLVRKRSNVYVVCASSSFDFFRLPQDISIRSPFDKNPLFVTYFSEKNIESALELLQGEGRYFVDIKEWIPEVAKKIYAETEGHTCLSAYYFLCVRDILEMICSAQYSLTLTSFLDEFNNMISYTLPALLSVSRIIGKIKAQLNANSSLALKIESSCLLYDQTIPFDSKQEWHCTILRLGIARIVPGHSEMKISCNTMKKLFLQAIAPTITIEPHLSNLCTQKPGLINSLIDLLKILFQYLNINAIMNENSWTLDRISKSPEVLGPSEKTYQTELYVLLSSWCAGSAFWFPTFEMIAGSNEKVDLGLSYKDLCGPGFLYHFEFGVNLPAVGPHSAQSHYDRQCNVYSNNSRLTKSLVIMIYTNPHPKAKFFWPEKVHDQVSYVQVQHFLSKDPMKVTIKSVSGVEEVHLKK